MNLAAGLGSAGYGVKRGYDEEIDRQHTLRQRGLEEQEHAEDREYTLGERARVAQEREETAPLKALQRELATIETEQALRIHPQKADFDQKQMQQEFAELQMKKYATLNRMRKINSKEAAAAINRSPDIGVENAFDVIEEEAEIDGRPARRVRVVDQNGNTLSTKDGVPLEFDGDSLDMIESELLGTKQSGKRYSAASGIGIYDTQTGEVTTKAPAKGTGGGGGSRARGSFQQLEDGTWYNPMTQETRPKTAMKPRGGSRGAGGVKKDGTEGAKAGYVLLNNGKQISYAQLKTQYEAENMETSGLGTKRPRKGAPTYREWFEENVDPEYHNRAREAATDTGGLDTEDMEDEDLDETGEEEVEATPAKTPAPKPEKKEVIPAKTAKPPGKGVKLDPSNGLYYKIVNGKKVYAVPRKKQ